MTTLDVTQCGGPETIVEPGVESMELSVQAIGTGIGMTGAGFTETPPPTPPYSPQHSNHSSTSSIPTFVEEAQDKTYTTLQSAKDKNFPSLDEMDTEQGQYHEFWGY